MNVMEHQWMNWDKPNQRKEESQTRELQMGHRTFIQRVPMVWILYFLQAYFTLSLCYDFGPRGGSRNASQSFLYCWSRERDTESHAHNHAGALRLDKSRRCTGRVLSSPRIIQYPGNCTHISIPCHSIVLQSLARNSWLVLTFLTFFIKISKKITNSCSRTEC